MCEIKRVVAIGAHSLDAELMGGPLIIKYVKENNAKCTLLHVTQGRLEDPNATKEEMIYLKIYWNKMLKQLKN